MYTQGLDQKGGRQDQEGESESPERLAAFQQRIDAEEKIEAKDWMPAAYRRTPRRCGSSRGRGVRSRSSSAETTTRPSR
jgi:hypothetical protein